MFEPGSLPALGLFLLQNPADALFRQVVSSAQSRNTCACGIVASDTVIPSFQLGFIVRFLSPGVPSSRLAGDVDVHTIGVFLNLSDQTLRQDFFCTLREKPELMDSAASWFNSKWGVPKEAYLECMGAYLKQETELGWFLCLDGERIVGGLGVIENDFHDRPDLTPNVCAVYTEESYRCKGIAGTLLNMAVEDLRSKGISPAYLVTDHTGFYERYGWEFLCMVQGDGEPDMTRMFIHR